MDPMTGPLHGPWPRPAPAVERELNRIMNDLDPHLDPWAAPTCPRCNKIIANNDRRKLWPDSTGTWAHTICPSDKKQRSNHTGFGGEWKSPGSTK